MPETQGDRNCRAEVRAALERWLREDTEGDPMAEGGLLTHFLVVGARKRYEEDGDSTSSMVWITGGADDSAWMVRGLLAQMTREIDRSEEIVDE